jgi:hypothetical protein
LPNGAEINRQFAFDVSTLKFDRIDLQTPAGHIIARNVHSLCWNWTAVAAAGQGGDFLWIAPHGPVVHSSDMTYWRLLEETGLRAPAGDDGTCGGFYSRSYRPEVVLDGLVPRYPNFFHQRSCPFISQSFLRSLGRESACLDE